MAGYIGKSQSITQVDGYNKTEADSKFVEGDDTLYVDETNNRVGIGTSSPDYKLHVAGNTAVVKIQDLDNTLSQTGLTNVILGQDSADSDAWAIGRRFGSTALKIENKANSSTIFETNSTERMRIDSSGNLLVGTTSTSHQDGSTTEAFSYVNGGYAAVSRSGGVPLYVNRQTTDGDIVGFRKDGATVGSIGTRGGDTFIASTTQGIRFYDSANSLLPTNNVGAGLDNVIDLGFSTIRWDDVYATNGTIQTSDEREKQDVAVLTPTEMLVAKRISGLFKTFRWIDKVEEKGADARIHSGVIAQDVKAAFEAEGLDAGRYAFFIHTTWWETTEVVPAVEAKEAVLDEEGNVVEEAVEAQEERTVVETHDTAVEGGVERDRMGVRYPQLLAFVAAYNEQRMASIEARLDALEAN